MDSPHALGWIPQLGDIRDQRFSVTRDDLAALPPSVDLRPGFPEVMDQGSLSSCVGHGVAAALEFDRRKQGLEDWAPSRLFIYFCAREMEGTILSDAGCCIRDGIKVVNSLGAPHESLWPYDLTTWSRRPPLEAYEDALTHTAVQYEAVPQDMAHMKACLAGGYPIVLGISLYESFESDAVAHTGIVPMPTTTETLLGGHCVVLCGFSDDTGTWLIRNSWGQFGDAGHVHLPYAYLTSSTLASDFWKISLTS